MDSDAKTSLKTRTRGFPYPREENPADETQLPTPFKNHPKPSIGNLKTFISSQVLTDILGMWDRHSVGSNKIFTSKLAKKTKHLLVQLESEKEKENMLLLLLPELLLLKPKTVIFCGTEEIAKKVYDILREARMECLLVHAHCNLTWEMDERKQSRLVVATDVILKSSLAYANIINFDTPSTVATYVKRAAFTSRCHEFMSTSEEQSLSFVINFEANEADRMWNLKVKRDLQIKFEEI